MAATDLVSLNNSFVSSAVFVIHSNINVVISGYVKTILLISIVLFPKYFVVTKSGIHTIVLTDLVYCIFR